LAEVIYPTSLNLRGPLLLSSDTLKQLDSVLTQHQPVLVELRSKRIDQYVSERVLQAKQEGMTDEDVEKRKKNWAAYARETVPEFSRNLTVSFSDGTRLEATSFAEASAHSEFSTAVANGFELSVACSSLRMNLAADSDSYDTSMKLRVSPSNAEGATNLFADVRRWMRTVQAPWAQQWWCALGHAKPVIWGAFVIAVLIALGFSIGNKDEGYYRKQAQDLMQQGVSSSNQGKAIETLLALESKASAPTSHALSHWYWFFLIGTFAVALILSYPPKLVLGLGSGDDKIKLWRAWTKFVLVIVPTFVASNFLWPHISELVKKWFS
jgi:hypothetical protein